MNKKVVLLLDDKQFVDNKNKQLVSFANEKIRDDFSIVIVTNKSTEVIKQEYSNFVTDIDVIRYTEFNLSGIIQILSDFFREENISLILMTDNKISNEIGKRISVKLGKIFCSNVSYFTIEGEETNLTRKLNGGQRLEKIKLLDNVIITGSFPVTEHKFSEKPDTNFKEKNIAYEYADRYQYQIKDVERHNLVNSQTVVAGGLGLKDKEGFLLLQKLADKLHGCVGASLPAANSGLVGKDKIIGQSGTTVAPRLYLAFGISGMVQHTVGMDKSKNVVVINSDENAPIFSMANYGIIGNAKEVATEMLNQL